MIGTVVEPWPLFVSFPATAGATGSTEFIVIRAPSAVLGLVVTTSDAAAGKCSSGGPEDFCERSEGPGR